MLIACVRQAHFQMSNTSKKITEHLRTRQQFSGKDRIDSKLFPISLHKLGIYQTGNSFCVRVINLICFVQPPKDQVLLESRFVDIFIEADAHFYCKVKHING